MMIGGLLTHVLVHKLLDSNMYINLCMKLKLEFNYGCMINLNAKLLTNLIMCLVQVWRLNRNYCCPDLAEKISIRI